MDYALRRDREQFGKPVPGKPWNRTGGGTFRWLDAVPNPPTAKDSSAVRQFVRSGVRAESRSDRHERVRPGYYQRAEDRRAAIEAERARMRQERAEAKAAKEPAQ